MFNLERFSNFKIPKNYEYNKRKRNHVFDLYINVYCIMNKTFKN